MNLMVMKMLTAVRNFTSVYKILVTLCLIFLVQNMGKVSAEVVTVSVCGVAADQNAALENAKKLAVEKVLTRFVAPNQDPTSEFSQLSKNYNEFVISADVFKKQKSKKQISLYTRVQVDAGKIQSLLTSRGKSAQQMQEYLEACFLIRVTGLTNDRELKSGESTVYKVCSDTFQRLGFRVTNSDEALMSMEEESSSENFFRHLLDLVDEEFPEITLAVVGEVKVDKTGSAGSFGADTYIHLRAVDTLSRKTIADFEEVYRSRGNSDSDAVRLALEKAAMNASETLAEKSRVYFKNRKEVIN